MRWAQKLHSRLEARSRVAGIQHLLRYVFTDVMAGVLIELGPFGPAHEHGPRVPPSRASDCLMRLLNGDLCDLESGKKAYQGQNRTRKGTTILPRKPTGLL